MHEEEEIEMENLNPFQIAKENDSYQESVSIRVPSILLKCPICTNDYNLNEHAPAYWLSPGPKCYHTYCLLCVTSWLTIMNYECPLCIIQNTESTDGAEASIQYNSTLITILQLHMKVIRSFDEEMEKFQLVQKILKKRKEEHQNVNDSTKIKLESTKKVNNKGQNGLKNIPLTQDEYQIAKILTLRSKKTNPKFFMCFTSNNKMYGKIILETRPDLAPKMAENFGTFCSSSEPSFNYKNSLIFQVCQGEMIRGGDIQLNNGQGGYSIYDRKKFPADESPLEPRPGAIVMARWATDVKTKKDLVGSQFIIRLNVCGSDRGRILGYVIAGMDVLHKISCASAQSIASPPISKIIISDCGYFNEKQ